MPHPDMNQSWAGGHPDEGLLHEWLDEQLSAADAAEMQEHVTTCAECGARVAEARGLIAASHRILSALDEVPANVLPTNMVATSSITNASNEVATGVTSIESARSSTAKTVQPRSKSAFRWQSLGKIAAVLIVAVAIGKVGFSGDDIVAPSAVAKLEPPVDASSMREAAPATVQPARSNDASAAGVQSPAAPLAESQLAGAQLAGAQLADAAKRRATSPEQTAKRAERDQVAAAPPASQQSVANNNQVAAAGAAEREDVRRDASAARKAKPDSLSALAPATVTAASPVESRRLAFSTAPVDSMPARDKAGPPAAAPAPAPPSVSVPAGASVAGGVARGGTRSLSSRTTLDGMVVAATSPSGKAAISSTPVRRSLFDSVTLNRTLCDPVCEATTIQVNAAGDVRFAIGAGNTQRVAMGKLSPGGRDSLSALFVRSFPNASTRFGRTTCEVRDRESLQLLIDYSAKLPARANIRCGKSNEDLRSLGAAVDSIAGIDALRQRVPPQKN